MYAVYTRVYTVIYAVYTRVYTVIYSCTSTVQDRCTDMCIHWIYTGFLVYTRDSSYIHVCTEHVHTAIYTGFLVYTRVYRACTYSDIHGIPRVSTVWEHVYRHVYTQLYTRVYTGVGACVHTRVCTYTAYTCRYSGYTCVQSMYSDPRVYTVDTADLRCVSMYVATVAVHPCI